MRTGRIDRVRSVLREEDLDAFLVTAAPDIRWCCGFSGSAGVLLVGPSKVTLLTDRRYRNQAAEEVSAAEVVIYEETPIAALKDSDLLAGVTRLGIDAAHVTLELADMLKDGLPDLEVRPASSPFKELFAQKDDGELAAMRNAQSISDSVLTEVLELLRPGLTESEVAAEIVYRHLLKGAGAMAFDPIVASGPNAALPHAKPSNRTIRKGDVVVLDFGCFIDGYASDMTRTVAIGRPSGEVSKAYDVVLSAQSKAEESARSGMVARELDGIGRSVIEDAGFGEAFTHSLGHGIGLRVHEWPRISRSSSDTLPESTVVTIEPGIYIPGSFGIRIENSVLVNPSGAEPLPLSEKSLIVI